MSSIHCLPTDVLIRIFSSLKMYELLIIEKVCHQWKTALNDHLWNRWTRITLDEIDYPRKGHFKNFLDIVDRVKEVSEFFTVLSLLHSEVSSHRHLWQKLENVKRELLRKRTADAVLPLDFIESALEYESAIDEWEWERSPTLLEAHVQVVKVMNDLQVIGFTAIKFEELPLYSPSSGNDRFFVHYKGREVEMPFDGSRITKMHVEWLAISIAENDWSAKMAAKKEFARFSSFVKLEHVEFDGIRLVLPSVVEDEPDVMSVTLHFHPHQCVFTGDEFRSLLNDLTSGDSAVYTPKLINLIDGWKRRGCVKKGDLQIHTVEFDRIEFLVLSDGHLEKSENIDSADRILNLIYPELIEEMHLMVPCWTAEEADLMSLLQEKDLFSRLKTFAVTFTDHQGEELGEFMSWQEDDGVDRVKEILLRLKNNMQQLETLELAFHFAGDLCPTSLFEPFCIVTEPLPRLHTLEYFWFPCFPFLVSAVEQAPNLHTLVVSSQQFDDEQLGLDWVKRLLRALEGKASLCSIYIDIHIKTSGEEYRVSDDTLRTIEEIKGQVAQLVASMPQLSRVAVRFEGCHQVFFFDKERDESDYETEGSP